MTGSPPATPEGQSSDPDAVLAHAWEIEARCRRFLADATHQLRTPIAGIHAAAENLLRGADPPDRTRLLADVVRETARVSRVLTLLLLIARLDEGEPISPRPCNLVGLSADEIDRASSLAPHLDFDLESEGLAQDEPELDGDALREVISNLLDNARRHAASRIGVLVRPIKAGVEIRVTDDGPGVPNGWEERVFERFVSIGERAGSGLGLAIARELARRHGGDLRYTEGAFVLWVPVEETGEDAVVAGLAPPPVPASPAQTGDERGAT